MRWSDSGSIFGLSFFWRDSIVFVLFVSLFGHLSCAGVAVFHRS